MRWAVEHLPAHLREQVERKMGREVVWRASSKLPEPKKRSKYNARRIHAPGGIVFDSKLEYAEYVEQGLRLLRHGGVLAVDNALWHDRVADETNTDDQTESVRAALAAVGDNEDLVSALLPVGDGLLVAVKR